MAGTFFWVDPDHKRLGVLHMQVMDSGVGQLRERVAAAAYDVAPKTSISTQTADNITINGEQWFGNLGPNTPLILLFHQAGSNGRGEYGPLQGWLNGAGYRAIAWDQRSGGGRFGSQNRTKAELPAKTPKGYCDAYADLEAALAYVKQENLADEVIIWGSSYSAALVFHLAADHPDQVSAVVSASTATGKALSECRAKKWVAEIKDPVLALRPGSEMARQGAKEQRQLFEHYGVDYIVADEGVHGSSMLVDTRTKHDMSLERAQVLGWLDEHVRATAQ
jgi:pimeloyl-ACP methyl ester carboxylesterase